MDLKLFGQLVKTERLAMGLTQEELGEIVGYSGNYISMMERAAPHSGSGGRVRPAEELVEALAKAFSKPSKPYRKAAGYDANEEEEPDIRLARKLDVILRSVHDQQKRQKIEDLLETDAAKYVSLLTV